MSIVPLNSASGLRVFPVLAILVSVLAWFWPEPFAVALPWISPLLALVMLAMGITLTLDDFRRLATRPAPVLAGLGLHYLIMPLAALGIARLLHLPPDLTAGMILTGSVASGTASTVMVYLSGGEVALSVTISACSTLVGVAMTPLLTWLYTSSTIPIDYGAMLLSIVEIVLLPVGLGLLLRQTMPAMIARVEPGLPILCMAAVIIIIGAIVSAVPDNTLTEAAPMILAVAMHNTTGLLGGYFGGRLLGFNEAVCRTLALEVGMQNSGLAATLARLYISSSAAIPGVFFSIWHNLSGSLLAGYWSRHPASLSTRQEPPARHTSFSER
ncbi:Transporter, Sodium/bile acid symporter family [Granulibacter bethesdensis]|uniref:ketopantoate/pantoate/pantothenate transporter PanS n=1 Tax=Granulibacter bethesdensis TaxID=364410 RepID=UPI00090C7D32|nr:bile acid:sodium symporter family protein [Granulibacter bethesdensis]APH57711.1 Transporter, Sodium/bile acid symporter family [Granulibacter bethesdensis]